MTAFDYTAEAELFASVSRFSKRRSLHYKRFALASGAIRYALEDLPRDQLPGTYLEVNGDRFDHQGIGRLYSSPDYPLVRAVRGSQ